MQAELEIATAEMERAHERLLALEREKQVLVEQVGAKGLTFHASTNETSVLHPVNMLEHQCQRKEYSKRNSLGCCLLLRRLGHVLESTPKALVSYTKRLNSQWRFCC